MSLDDVDFLCMVHESTQGCLKTIYKLVGKILYKQYKDINVSFTSGFMLLYLMIQHDVEIVHSNN